MAATTKEQMLKVAETKEKMAAKRWARAKSDPEKYGYEFENARKMYETAKKARESAKKLK